MDSRLNRVLHIIRLWFMSKRPEGIVNKRKMSDINITPGSLRTNSLRSGSARTQRFTRMTEDAPEQPDVDEGGRIARERTPSNVGPDGIYLNNEKPPSLGGPAPDRDPSPISESDYEYVRPRPRMNGGFGINPRARYSSARVLSTRLIHSSRAIFQRVLRDEVSSTCHVMYYQPHSLTHLDIPFCSCSRLQQ